MRLYDVIITEDMLIKGVKALSLVEEPALKSNFIALAEEVKLIELTEVDKEKRIVMGAVLIPETPIFRKGNPEDFYIRFSKETVESAQEHFFRAGMQNFSTLNHSGENIDGNTVVESWIVEDVEKDKTALYNLSIPKGSWVVKMKVNNDEVWNDYVKTGKVKGFSIEGFFRPVEMAELSSQELTPTEKVEKIRTILNEN